MDDNLFERLVQCYPTDWTGRSLVDLDDFGDCGHHLQEFLWNSNGESLLDTSVDLDSDASTLTEMYLQARERQGTPFPFECFESKEQAIQATQDDFKAFLYSWRECVQDS